MTLRFFCAGVALMLFAIAALGIGSGRFNLIAGGLFFWLAADTFG